MTRRLKDAAIILVVTALLFVLLEGTVSTGRTLIRFFSAFNSGPAEQAYSQYDEKLGWIQIPNMKLENYYGPGKDLHTNSQSARGVKEYPREVEPGKIRMLFSGDSFTHGFGVADDDVWNQLVAARSSNLEAVNFGHGGYGIGQAYLLYKRKSKVLDHDIHVFSFITDDFVRARLDKFVGHDKPLLKVESGKLVVTNTPIPSSAKLLQRWTWNRYILRQLASLDLALSLKEGFQSSGQMTNEPSEDSGLIGDSALREVVTAVFADLKNQADQRGVTLVLAYLPTAFEYSEGGDQPKWRQFLHTEAARLGIPIFDALPDLRELKQSQVRSLYIAPEDAFLRGAEGHLNEDGNRFIADLFYSWLTGLPEFQKQLKVSVSSKLHK